jgi:16S rRNA (guanine527-N7)-methyltransferase
MEKAEEKLELITKYFADFSPAQLEQLKMLEPLYRDWNSKINVISRKDEDCLYEKHVLHSLSIAAAFDFLPGMKVMDLGTGGGFPGIPMAIFFPEVQFHLVDSIGKKIKVVQAVAEALQLKNVTAEQKRAEEIKDRKFDVVVSRAVAPLGELWKWTKPLLRRGERGEQRADGRLRPPKESAGREEGEESLPVPYGLICLKGGDLTKEIAESGCRPAIMEVYDIFPEESFREKFLVYVRG